MYVCVCECLCMSVCMSYKVVLVAKSSLGSILSYA